MYFWNKCRPSKKTHGFAESTLVGFLHIGSKFSTLGVFEYKSWKGWFSKVKAELRKSFAKLKVEKKRIQIDFKSKTELQHADIIHVSREKKWNSSFKQFYCVLNHTAGTLSRVRFTKAFNLSQFKLRNTRNRKEKYEAFEVQGTQHMFCEAFETGRLIGFHTKIKMRPMYSCFPAYINVQGDSFHWYPPKELKYGKPGLVESTLT